ncbi:hypothetical protein SAMN04487893_101185 [Myroides guanonis]|uniref:Uncharacterized protein n=1 Tax=Myroides guanonis TaxID=1150112 RepID=A0A1I3L5G1_9FLAO|nr:hypothetical protein SAMN04487893_101185 [Myroides guanonis]
MIVKLKRKITNQSKERIQAQLKEEAIAFQNKNDNKGIKEEQIQLIISAWRNTVILFKSTVKCSV